MVKKKAKAETKTEEKNGDNLKSIQIYKVCIPSFLAYPSWQATLKVCYTKEEAERYIRNYPNIMITHLLSIVEEKFYYYGTD